MIGAYHTDTPIGESLTQGLAVTHIFYGRVHLNLRTQTLVVGLREEQMAHRSLGGDGMQTVGWNEFQLSLCSDMSNVQTCFVPNGQLNGFRR